jgi:putative colanic acid biosynthesis acetyltransferase WcaF
MGTESSLGPNVICYSMDKIILGERAIVSQGSHLCTGTHDHANPGFKLVTRPIVIGSHAWICAEVFVHPGINVGEGAIAGARSVVTRDLPPWMICAGNPCKPIKPRMQKAQA